MFRDSSVDEEVTGIYNYVSLLFNIDELSGLLGL